MSCNYKCGQYNDSFQPTRLRNWCQSTNCCAKICQPARRYRDPCHLSFLADDRGHLLPEVKSRMYPPPRPCWGPEVLSIWDIDPIGCGCNPINDKRRQRICDPNNNLRALPRFFKQHPPIHCPGYTPPEPPPKPEPVKPHEDIVEGAFNELRKLRIPVIWIIGYPSPSIAAIRDDFVNQLVHRLGFTHIELDKEVSRMVELLQVRNSNRANGNTNYDLLAEYKKLRRHDEETNQNLLDENSPFYEYLQGAQPTVDVDDDKTNDNFGSFGTGSIAASEIHLDPEGNPKTQVDAMLQLIQKASSISAKDAASHPNTTTYPFFPPHVFHKCLNRLISIAERLLEKHDIKFSTNGIILLLKMTMLLNYPTNGYVIDQFPINLDEAEMFEEQIWPYTVGLYFVHFTGVNKNERVVEKPFEPVYAQRQEAYDEPSAEFVCDNFGDRMVKILHGDIMNKKEIFYINCLVDAFLGKPQCQKLLASLREGEVVNVDLDEEEVHPNEEFSEPFRSSIIILPDTTQPKKIDSDKLMLHKLANPKDNFGLNPDLKPEHESIFERESKVLYRDPKEQLYSQYMVGPKRLNEIKDLVEPNQPKLYPQMTSGSGSDSDESDGKEPKKKPTKKDVVIDLDDYRYDATDYRPEQPPTTLPFSKMIPDQLSSNSTLALQNAKMHDPIFKRSDFGGEVLPPKSEQQPKKQKARNIESDQKKEFKNFVHDTFEENEDWMDDIDQKKKEHHVPFTCCFEKHKGGMDQGSMYDLNPNAPNYKPRPEPKQHLTFKEKFKNFFGGGGGGSHSPPPPQSTTTPAKKLNSVQKERDEKLNKWIEETETKNKDEINKKKE